MWISAATLGGLWRDGALNQYQHLRPRTGGRFYPRPVQTSFWSRAKSEVTLLIFVSYSAPSAHSPPRAEEWWDSTGAILCKVFRPTRDRIVMIDASGRLGEAPTLLLENSCRPDFDDRGHSLHDFLHDWGTKAPASFGPLPLSTWTSRAGKEHETDSVFISLAWYDLVQWSAIIPRVTLALQDQEDHWLVATQVASQPKPTVAVAPSTFFSHDALRDPETVKKIEQFYDGVPAIPPKARCHLCCRAFFQAGVHCLSVLRSPLRSRAAQTLDHWAVLGSSTAAS